MLTCYFVYQITGVKTREHTIESPCSLLDPRTRHYAFDLLDRLNLDKKFFTRLIMPGQVAGELLPEIQKEVCGNAKVVLCASHDTASAFEAVDVDEESLILSSGTWSLLGIKLKDPIISKTSFEANYTNEGGVGYIRFLKNIMGMYLTNRVIEETGYTFDEIAEGLKKTSYNETFDVNDPSLNAPKEMKPAILNLLQKNPPKNDFDVFASIYHSMALCYKKSVEELQKITGKRYKKLYIVGGGAKNKYLNELVEKYTKLKVVAMPIEATSLGNIKVQMKASGELK
jgi:rhamnulokinase